MITKHPPDVNTSAQLPVLYSTLCEIWAKNMDIKGAIGYVMEEKAEANGDEKSERGGYDHSALCACKLVSQ